MLITVYSKILMKFLSTRRNIAFRKLYVIKIVILCVVSVQNPGVSKNAACISLRHTVNLNGELKSPIRSGNKKESKNDIETYKSIN